MAELSEGQIWFVEHRIPFWDELDETQRDLVRAGIQHSKIPQGTQFLRGSDECSGMILLMEGRMRAYVSSDDGREITLYRLLPGEVCVMTASCMLKGARFQIFIEAERDSSMFVVPQSIFIRLNTENSAVKDFTMNLMVDRFSETVLILEQAAFESIPNRIAEFLMEQSGLDDARELVITHETIARNIGTAREVVSRTLKAFEKDGLVRLTRGRVVLLDTRKLFSLTTR